MGLEKFLVQSLKVLVPALFKREVLSNTFDYMFHQIRQNMSFNFSNILFNEQKY